MRFDRLQRGSAVVDFVLVAVVLVPLVLGIVQVGLVLHVRNTLTSAASEGARYAASAEQPITAGVERTRRRIDTALAGRFARDIRAARTSVAGASVIVVNVVADVPPLGLWGPAVRLDVTGRAVKEVLP